jgi:hypothetical protein
MRSVCRRPDERQCWEAPGGPTPPTAARSEVTFEAVDGETLLRLRHTGLAPETVEALAAGWDQFLPALASVAAAA